MKTTEQLILENVQLPLPSAHPDYEVEKMNRVLSNVASELLRAKTLFPAKFVNQHEGYAVLLEEVDELWIEIKKNQKNYDLDAQRKEATQAAAMLVRFIVELL